MKVLVLGAGGMLGKAIVGEFRTADIKTVGLKHDECDILQPQQLETARDEHQPDLVINCAGAPNRNELVNSLGPWYVSRTFKSPTRIWHISTDCVFNHEARSTHKPTDTPYPVTEYGISKLLGEQIAPNVSNIRTSFIGFDHGLLRWLLDQEPGTVINGWDQAFWSGSTVDEIARTMSNWVLNREVIPNVCHLAVATSHAVTKYDLIAKLIRHFKLDLSLRRDSSVYINRLLEPTKYLDPVDEAIRMLPLKYPQPETEAVA